MLCILIVLACQRGTHLAPDTAPADSSHLPSDTGANDTARDSSSASDTSADTATDTAGDTASDTSDTAVDTSDTSDAATDTSSDTGAPADPWAICESYARPTARGRVEDGALDEISGIAVSRQEQQDC